MIKYITSGIAFLMLNLSGPNCKSLRQGTFKIDADQSNYVIIRDENKQIEKIPEAGAVIQYRIKWTSDCSYLLYDRKLLKGVDRMPDIKIDTLFCKIINVSGSKHTVSMYSKEYDKIVESVLVKVDKGF